MSIQAVIGQQNPSSKGAAPEPPEPSPSPSAGSSMPAGGRSGMGNGSAPSPSEPPSGTGPSTTSNGKNQKPAITAETKGVVGLSDLMLVPTSDAEQGSVLSSEKKNVKLEGGTLMLLKVNQ